MVAAVYSCNPNPGAGGFTLAAVLAVLGVQRSSCVVNPPPRSGAACLRVLPCGHNAFSSVAGAHDPACAVQSVGGLLLNTGRAQPSEPGRARQPLDGGGWSETVTRTAAAGHNGVSRLIPSVLCLGLRQRYSRGRDTITARGSLGTGRGRCLAARPSVLSLFFFVSVGSAGTGVASVSTARRHVRTCPALPVVGGDKPDRTSSTNVTRRLAFAFAVADE